MILDPNDRETIYFAADGVDWNATSGIFKSTDGGSTWATAGLQGKEGDPLGSGPTGSPSIRSIRKRFTQAEAQACSRAWTVGAAGTQPVRTAETSRCSPSIH